MCFFAMGQKLMHFKLADKNAYDWNNVQGNFYFHERMKMLHSNVCPLWNMLQGRNHRTEMVLIHTLLL